MSVQIPKEVISCSNFINGDWIQGSGGTSDIISPYNGKKIGHVTIPSQDQIKEALSAAEKAQVEWGKSPLKERARVLFNFREIPFCFST